MYILNKAKMKPDAFQALLKSTPQNLTLHRLRKAYIRLMLEYVTFCLYHYYDRLLKLICSETIPFFVLIHMPWEPQAYLLYYKNQLTLLNLHFLDQRKFILHISLLINLIINLRIESVQKQCLLSALRNLSW